MAFRAKEDAGRIFNNIVNYSTRHLDQKDKDAAILKLLEVSSYYGYAVESYPSWHPLVATAASIEDNGPSCPEECSGYKELDHSFYFANAFITCPFAHAVDKVLESIASLPKNLDCIIEAQVLDVKLYSPESPPILVTCQWNDESIDAGLIPKSLAIPLMLEDELSRRGHYSAGETWETMRPTLLGSPYGSLSSLFVDQKTGQAMKAAYNCLVNSGAFGPLKV